MGSMTMRATKVEPTAKVTATTAKATKPMTATTAKATKAVGRRQHSPGDAAEAGDLAAGQPGQARRTQLHAEREKTQTLEQAAAHGVSEASDELGIRGSRSLTGGAR